jgi:hypothetical protein
VSDVDRLFEEFKAAWDGGGGTDPAIFVTQVSGADRAELEALIAAFLARAPRQPLDQSRLAGSRAADVLARLDADLVPAESLVDLRNDARITRATLVARLSDALGVGRQREKVAGYYHDLEWGSLSPDGVSARVWEALGGILGKTADAVRAAALTPPGERGPAGTPEQAFLRAIPSPGPSASAAPPSSDAAAEEPWDEVDELFRGRQA